MEVNLPLILNLLMTSSDLVMEVSISALVHVFALLDKLPPTLYIQLNNCYGSNKNRTPAKIHQVDRISSLRTPGSFNIKLTKASQLTPARNLSFKFENIEDAGIAEYKIEEVLEKVESLCTGGDFENST